MTRGSLGSKAVVSLLVLTLVGGWMVVPGMAHDGASITHNWNMHFKRLAKKMFYLKRQANTRFINVGEQASNSNLLDGLDSAAFASSSHVHGGGDITSGTVDESVIDVLIARVADVFDIVLAADGPGSGLDADLLDGMSSGAFEVEGLSIDARWFKETADVLPTAATTERVVFTAPEGVTITDVFVEPSAALAASDTNYATIVIARRDATGGNKVTVATETTQTSGSGGSGDWTAFGTVSLGSPSNTSLAEGQKLTPKPFFVISTVSLPALIVQFEYTVN